jgi:hypothetical protein
VQAPLERPLADPEVVGHLFHRKELGTWLHPRSFTPWSQVLIIARVCRVYLREIADLVWRRVVICHQRARARDGCDARLRHHRELGLALDEKSAPARQEGRDARRAAAGERVEHEARGRNERPHEMRDQLRGLARRMAGRVPRLGDEEELVVLAEARLGDDQVAGPAAALGRERRALRGIVVEALVVDALPPLARQPKRVDAFSLGSVVLVDERKAAVLEI